jgi:hypothetical protein
MQVRPGAQQAKGSTLLLPCFDKLSMTVCRYCQLCQCQVSSEMRYVTCYHCQPLRCR